MKLEVVRFEKTTSCTIGSMYVNGKWECYTLEDVVRTGPKIYGETAIPDGVYQVQVTFSNRFRRELPLLIDVPGFEGVRIHPGNTDKDTEGCILVGKSKGPNAIYNSRDAFNTLFGRIMAAWWQKESISIEVKNA